MKKGWFEQEGLKCVVVCGGLGSRLGDIGKELPKSLVPISGKPILGHILDYWQRYTKEFLFIPNYMADKISRYVKELDISSEVVIEKGEPQGIAKALLLAEPFVQNNLIVILGDCLVNGAFITPKGMVQGVGVWETEREEDIKRSYSVETNGDKAVKVVEKPTVLVNNLCGMGFYFFDRRVFNYIRNTKPSEKTGRVEITDVIQTMINADEEVSSVNFRGRYLNVTYPDDLMRAEELLR